MNTGGARSTTSTGLPDAIASPDKPKPRSVGLAGLLRLSGQGTVEHRQAGRLQLRSANWSPTRLQASANCRHTMTALNWNSRHLTHGWQKGLTAFYYGLGFDEADFDRPQVGIGVPLLEGNLCNMHAYGLGQDIAAGCREAGLIGFPFGTPGVSDNISQGHDGGNASLPSRNIIANCAEMVCHAHGYDALIGLHCCDKNGPGFAMALARLNFPGLIVSGGS